MEVRSSALLDFELSQKVVHRILVFPFLVFLYWSPRFLFLCRLPLIHRLDPSLKFPASKESAVQVVGGRVTE